MAGTDMYRRFQELHSGDVFIIPNPWDIGSARIFEGLGFPALATTSAGHAAALGRMDQQVSLDELLEHAESIAGAVDIPLNLDSERCFADDPAGVAKNVALMAETGAAGCSIEDYNPATEAMDPIELAAERVAAAVEAAAGKLVVTARAENHIYGIDGLPDTMARLAAFRDAGAEVVYAPGLRDLDAIESVVQEIGLPVNVLALPKGPSVPELASVGVRRVSTGGLLSRAAHGALVHAGQELLESGTSTYASGALRNAEAYFS